MHRPD